MSNRHETRRGGWERAGGEAQLRQHLLHRLGGGVVVEVLCRVSEGVQESILVLVALGLDQLDA